MKHLAITLCSSMLLISCYFKPTKFAESTRLEDGWYRAGNGWTNLYFHVIGDSVYADVVITEKFPRELDSDTLYYNTGLQIWKSHKSQLFQKGRFYYYSSSYTCNTCSEIKNYDFKYDLRKDIKLNQQLVDANKNYAVVNEFYHGMIKSDTSKRVRARYYALKEKVPFFSNLNYISHTEFLKEFSKFKEELTKE